MLSLQRKAQNSKTTQYKVKVESKVAQTSLQPKSKVKQEVEKGRNQGARACTYKSFKIYLRAGKQSLFAFLISHGCRAKIHQTKKKLNPSEECWKTSNSFYR